MAKQKSGYARKNAEFVKLDTKGASAEGYLVGVTVIEFEPKNVGDMPGHAPKLTMKKKGTGAMISVLAGSTVIDDAKALTPGLMTKIVFAGKVKTNKGFQAGSWELYQDESDVIEG
jgi:hypothetical protein